MKILLVGLMEGFLAKKPSRPIPALIGRHVYRRTYMWIQILNIRKNAGGKHICNICACINWFHLHAILHMEIRTEIDNSYSSSLQPWRTLCAQLKVNTLEGGVLTVQVTASNTMEDLKEMLCEQKQCEDPIQRKILKAEVLGTDGKVLENDGSAAGLLDAESEVSVVYSRNEVEVATKQAIYVEGFVQVNIPASVVAISARAFQTCYQVVKVEIPQSVTSIGHRAFERCSSLASITMPESVTAIEERVFEGCKSLESITIPESVTSIGRGAFERCSSLESITIPKSVTAIGGQAFFECSSLVSITIPESVSSIGVHAFAACTSLESITIPESVRALGHGAFEECTSLVRITIPRFVTAIEDYL